MEKMDVSALYEEIYKSLTPNKFVKAPLNIPTFNFPFSAAMTRKSFFANRGVAMLQLPADHAPVDKETVRRYTQLAGSQLGYRLAACTGSWSARRAKTRRDAPDPAT